MKKLNIIYVCLIFALLFCMCSCGARKSTVEKSKEQTEINTIDNSKTESVINTNVKTTTQTTINDKDESIIEETIYKPEDSSKEAFVIEKDGTKVILNNATKTTRKTTKKNNIQTQSSGNTEQVKKEAVKEQKSVEHKEVSKKENKSKYTIKSVTPWYYWLLLLIPISFIYWLGKRYKIF